MAPTRVRLKRPFLHTKLCKIRTFLDLNNIHRHRTMGALWPSQWQVVMRGGDLISRRGDGKGKWDPVKDTHRGRITVESLLE